MLSFLPREPEEDNHEFQKRTGGVTAVDPTIKPY